MTIHSSILAWGIPWTEEPGGLQSWGHKELNTIGQLHFSLFFFFLTQIGYMIYSLVSLLSLPSGILVCKYIITYSSSLPLLSAWVVSSLWL